MTEFAALRIPTGPLWRVGRAGSEFRSSKISPAIAELPAAGNRFDVLGGGVLYAASTPEGAFTETLQAFRPTTAIRAAVFSESPTFMIAGSVPRDWRERRRLACLTLDAPAPFLDIECPEIWPLIESAAAAELCALGVSHLDVGVIRGANRLVTRLIARWAYLASNPQSGEPIYGGIYYTSKLGHHECWAIFDGTQWRPAGQSRSDKHDRAYQKTCSQLDLVAH